MLVLPIKKKWFDMIVSGEKKEEYREVKPYYDKRLGFYCRYGLPTTLYFRNGYSHDSPKVKCRVKIRIDKGKEKWGAELGKIYYVLEIINIFEIENYKEEEK